MSRVFLADDVALKRSVVIKVLHPELAAGVNAERFNREVLLSARLQHPHIVPVLTAGDVNGLPYYVMPFVKGESLRARVAQGFMPIGDVVGVIGDVAKALGFAHEEGVVHRDIKPDNILLSGGAATVADFGIAKALSSSRQETGGDGGLTTLGMSLGTPEYMAPEQVAGDPDVDHRADIYSLGCVAYEMLTGKSPFAGKSPQQMLAAQVMEKPAPIEQKRPGVPPALAAVVMRCLEKEPSARPQTAAEILNPLDSTDVFAVVTQKAAKSRRGLLIAAGAAFVAAAIAVPVYRSKFAPPVAASGAMNLAVAPFEVLDPQLALWKEGIVDVLARNLDGAGPIRALSPSVTIKKWEGRAERGAAVAFGKRVGAQIVMYGQLQPAGQGLVSAKLWIVDAERDSPPMEVEVRDSISRMDRVTDSLSIRSLAAIGRMRTIGAAKLASLGSSSLPAIRAFLQGAQHFRRSQWDSAATALKEATVIDSTFGIAYAMLGEAYGWTGDGNELQWRAFTRAGELIRPGLSPHDSLTLASVRHYAIAHDRRIDRAAEMRNAYAAAAAVTERYPDDAAAWYLYSDMRVHNDMELSEQEARANFDRGIKADSDFAPVYIHAIELAYRDGAASGRRYAAPYLARTATGAQRDAIQLASLLADGTLRGDGMKAVLDTINPSVGMSAHSTLRRLPDSLEVANELLRMAVRRMPANRTVTMRRALADGLAARGHIAEAWRLALENPAYTAAEIVAMGLVPADSARRALLPWLKKEDDASIAAIVALGAARDTLTLDKLTIGAEARMKADTSMQLKAMLGYFAASTRAYATLARGDSTKATALFDKLSDTMFALPVDQFVRARLVARQDPKRALVLLERMTSAGDLMYAARQLERGRIAEKLGERERAVDAYAYVAAVWQNAEPAALKDAVKEARAALGRLDADGRMRATLAGRADRNVR